MVVDEVELGRPPVGGHAVHDLQVTHAHAQAGRLVEDVAQVRPGMRVAAGEQRDLVTAGHQPLGQLRDDELDAAVAARRQGEPRRGDHADLHGERCLLVRCVTCIIGRRRRRGAPASSARMLWCARRDRPARTHQLFRRLRDAHRSSWSSPPRSASRPWRSPTTTRSTAYRRPCSPGRRYGVEVVPGVEIPLEFESFTLDMLGYFLCGAALRRVPGAAGAAATRPRRAQRTHPADPERARLSAGAGRARTGRRRRGGRPAAHRRSACGGAATWTPSARRSSGSCAAARPPSWTAAGLGWRRRSVSSATPAAWPSSPTPASSAPTTPACAASCARRRTSAWSDWSARIPSTTSETEQRCLALAAEFGLVPTGGSDFHGSVKPAVRLGEGAGGRPIPDEVLEQLRARCP